MPVVTSTLDIRLIDDVTANGKRVDAALQRTQKQAAALDAALAKAGVSDKLAGNLKKIGASATHVEAVSKAWKEYSTEQGLAGKAAQEWSAKERESVRSWESVTISAIRAVKSEENALARQFENTALATERAQNRAAQAVERANDRISKSHEQHGGMGGVGSIAAVYAAHEAAHFAHQSLEIYREFDKERRYAQIVAGASDKQMEPLIKQAIHGSAISKYNDIQWLEGQRDLVSRGYSLDQTRAFAPIAALIGQAFDVSLPDGVKALEGAMLGFKKDVSTFQKAQTSAQRTADLEVKASKISGMSYEDIVNLYKVGAPSARMAHLSEESMLAFGAIAKKANMGGDESSTAFRALTKNLLTPTIEAKTAMMAAGIDFGKFQQAPKSMNLPGFVSEVARKYGVELSKHAQAGLARIFNDPKLLRDPSKFTPAIMHFLKGALSATDAKSLKSVAGLANRYRDASIGGVDTNGLLAALMAAISKNPSLANAVFGSKQGGRIFAALGDPTLYAHIMDQLLNHSQGFAQNVSDARMAGFDGAVSRFEGATKALEAALGRAFDNNGKGGFLTNMASGAAAFVQNLAEADPHIQRLAVEAAAAASAFAGMKGAEALLGGFGLKSSAAALTGAAEALTGAAEVQALGSGALTKAGKAGLIARLSGSSGMLGALGIAGAGLFEYLDWYKENHPEEFHAHAQHAYGLDKKSPELFGPFRKWDAPAGRNQGYKGHWDLDPEPHLAKQKLAFAEDALASKTYALKTSFDGLSGAAAGLSATLASFGGSGNRGGSGGGGNIIPASYNPDGGSGAGDGGSSFGAGWNARHSHGGGGSGDYDGGGGTSVGDKGSDAGLSGGRRGYMMRGRKDGPGFGPSSSPIVGAVNPRLAASRAKYFEELDRNPQLRRDVIKTASEENDGSPEKMLTVIESMVNRAQMLGYKSLNQAIHSGFYGPVNSGALRGGLSEKNRRDGEAALAAARHGSNIIGYRTDQGMLSDSGARKYFAQGGDRSGWRVIHGENFFYMGAQGREWAKQQEAADRAARAGPTSESIIKQNPDWLKHRGGAVPMPAGWPTHGHGHHEHAALSKPHDDPLGLKKRRQVSPAAPDAGRAIQALDRSSVRPSIDHSDLERHIALLEYAHRLHGGLGGGSSTAMRPRVAGLGSDTRGSFSRAGDSFRA